MLMAVTLIAVALPAGAASAQTPPGAAIVLPGGTRATDSTIGTGTEAQPGRYISVHYTGWLYSDGGRSKKFDSSRDRGQPFGFVLGAGDVIQGWDEGFAGMKVGGKRTLIIPSEAGYGMRGAGDDIPPGATLIFDVELLGVE
jgi:FKBP-type peptidyl-prolyl cis-trans isomerase